MCSLLSWVVLAIAPAGKAAVRLKHRFAPKYSQGFVVVCVPPLVADGLITLPSGKGPWRTQLVPTPSWIGSVAEPGVGSRGADDAEPDERASDSRAPRFFRVAVTPGTEPFALVLLRIEAFAVWNARPSVRPGPADQRLIVARWPVFELATTSPVHPVLTAEASQLLVKRAARAGSDRVRVAVVDTNFEPPPVVHTVVDPDPDSSRPPEPGSHGAAVCALILGSCPHAQIDLYPVLAEGRRVDSAAVYDALATIPTRPVDAVNLSLSVIGKQFPTGSIRVFDMLFDTIKQSNRARGCVIVAANGNQRGGRIRLPSRSSRVLSVGCVDETGRHWPASCSGPKEGSDPFRWVVACGVGLTPGQGGTSISAASVTGLVALTLSRGHSPADVERIVLASATASAPDFAQRTHGLGVVREGCLP
jgi:hypothetical protein